MRRAVVVACIGLSAAALSAPAAAHRASYDDLVRLYRSGSFERASSDLRHQELGALEELNVPDWCRAARREERHDDLVAALMLHTEVILDEVGADPRRLQTNAVIRTHDALIAAVHEQLRGQARTTPALRTWYLMWEALRQGFWLTGKLPLADYLPAALEAFPEDAGVLLAAGARHEQTWWSAIRNPVRNLAARPGAGESMLQDARRYFVRSVAANPKLVESHIRLGRVLTQLGDLDAAGAHLTGAASSGEAAFEYVRLLFLGDLHERQNDPGGAAAAYEEAIGLTPNAQSARLAASQLAHSVGRRSDAARGAMQAMDGPSTDIDPWWAYLRGQWWHLGDYLKQARAQVRAGRSGTTSR